MTDKEKAAAAIVLGAAIAAGAIVFELGGKDADPIDVGVVINSKDPVDSKTVTIKELPDAQDAGLVSQEVYAKVDDTGATIFLSIAEIAGEKVATYIKESPCAAKVKDGDDCTFSDGKPANIENVMKPGMWKGAGCTPKACTIIFGEPDP